MIPHVITQQQPFFFEDEQGATVMVNSVRYVQMLDTTFLPLTQDREEFTDSNLWLIERYEPRCTFHKL